MVNGKTQTIISFKSIKLKDIDKWNVNRKGTTLGRSSSIVLQSDNFSTQFNVDRITENTQLSSNHFENMDDEVERSVASISGNFPLSPRKETLTPMEKLMKNKQSIPMDPRYSQMNSDAIDCAMNNESRNAANSQKENMFFHVIEMEDTQDQTMQGEAHFSQSVLMKKLRRQMSQREKDQAQIDLKAEIISHEEDKFAEIQEMDDILPKDIMDSLCLDKNREKVFKAGEGSG